MTVVVVLENLLTVPVTVEDMQLVLTMPGAGGGEEEEEVACLALDEEEFHKMSVSVLACPIGATIFYPFCCFLFVPNS